MSPVRSRRPQDDLSRFSLPLVPGIPLYRGSVEDDLAVVSRNRLADEITGGLSRPSKMPGPAWGLPASRCKTGAKLAGGPGTTCSSCYELADKTPAGGKLPTRSVSEAWTSLAHASGKRGLDFPRSRFGLVGILSGSSTP